MIEWVTYRTPAAILHSGLWWHHHEVGCRFLDRWRWKGVRVVHFVSREVTFPCARFCLISGTQGDRRLRLSEFGSCYQLNQSCGKMIGLVAVMAATTARCRDRMALKCKRKGLSASNLSLSILSTMSNNNMYLGNLLLCNKFSLRYIYIYAYSFKTTNISRAYIHIYNYAQMY